MKVISILPFSSIAGSKVDIFADGFHTRIAQQIWKRNQKYELECWRLERKLKKPIISKKNGIIYKAFPAFRPSLGTLDMKIWKTALATFPYGRRIVSATYSLSLLKELRKQCQEEVLIQVNDGFSNMALLICLCCQNAPVVFAHVGGAPQTYSAFTTFWRLPFSLIERKAMSYTDKILAQSPWIYDRLSKIFSNVKLCCPWGVDFDLFKPIDKQRARNELGLPFDKRILLYVGRLDSIKGVDSILEIYKRMKPNVELVLVGGQKDDPLYRQAIESSAVVRGQVSQSELVPYYSAADVYLLPKFYTKRERADVEEFMSIGIAEIEAMACGVPSVGTNLYHLLGSEEELKQMGKIPNSPDNVAQCIAEVLDNPSQYKNCREIAEKYYGWDGIVKQMVSIYDELHEKYYG